MTDTRLPANLPENWEPGQIIAPTGTEVGLSEQHGYNYLMKQVNDSHRVINGQTEQLDNKVTLLQENLNLYVSKEGDDETGDGTEEKPFLTIQKAVDTAGDFSFGNAAVAVIYIHPGVYQESVHIMSMSNMVDIRSTTENKDDVIIEGAKESTFTLLTRTPYFVVVRNITLKGNSSQTNGVASSVWSGNLYLDGCGIESDGGGIGARCVNNSYLTIRMVEINNCKQAVYAGGASFIHAVGLTGTGNEVGYVASGGIITRNGTYVTATTDTATSAGGQVWPNPIVKHELALAAGFTKVNNACYWKTSEGVVTVSFRIKNNNSMEARTSSVIATLPTGFLPVEIVHGAIFLGSQAGVLSVHWNGEIHVTTFVTLQSGSDVWGSVTFLA